MAEPKDEYDSPWKEALEKYFKEFMEFFFPDACREIDWTREYEFLDKELQSVSRDAELGLRLVDKLVRVWTKHEEEAWVMAHIEIQGERESNFPKRMYVYNYRLFDRYDRAAASFAVLADEDENWRPRGFGYKVLGSEVSIIFPMVKVIDYEDRMDELEKNMNPFAIIVMAHIKTKATHGNPDKRFHWKWTLTKMLYERNYSKKDILEMYRIIDWFMMLPEDLSIKYTEKIIQYEEGIKMPYVTTAERIGIEKGERIGIEKGERIGICTSARKIGKKIQLIPPHLQV